MVFEVKFSEQAEGDLSEIIGYINYTLSNPKAADRFHIAVNEKIEFLREHPYAFPLHHGSGLDAEDYRFAVIGNFLMFYLVDEHNSIVNISRLLYGRRDIFSAFNG